MCQTKRVPNVKLKATIIAPKVIWNDTAVRNFNKFQSREKVKLEKKSDET